MKSILFILLFFCSVKTFAQIPAPDSCGGNRVNSCVNWYAALAEDSTSYPAVRPTLDRYMGGKGQFRTRPQLFIYNNILYWWSNGNYYSAGGGSVFDTVSLSDRINLRLLISDTVNNFDGRFLSNIIGIAAGGDLSSTYPNPTVAKFNGQFPAYYLNYNNLTNRPDLTGFIPITGTTTGNPVTGDIHIDAGGFGVGIVFNDVNDDMSRLLANGSSLIFNSLDGVHKNWSIDGTDLINNSVFKFINHGSATADTIATFYNIRTSIASINLDAIDVGVKVVQPVGVATYVVPVGTLVETILIQEPTNITVDVGTTPGGNDLIAGWNITGGASSLGLNYYSTSSSTIYVTGLTGSSQLKIYKR